MIKRAARPLMGDDGHVLEVEQRSAGPGRVVLTVRGEIDLASAAQLTAELHRAITETADVTIDLAEVGFVDSTGVRALVEAYRTAKRQDRRLRVQGARNWVAKVLDITGVGPLLAADA